MKVKSRTLKQRLAQLASIKDLKKYLLKNNCKGKRYLPDSCPIAIWFNKYGFDGIFVTSLFIREQGPDAKRINLPNNLIDFIKAFDNRKYPELIKFD